jgi:hypothetical protein
MVLVRLRRCAFSLRNSMLCFFLAMGYTAASQGPRCSTCVALSSTAYKGEGRNSREGGERDVATGE